MQSIPRLAIQIMWLLKQIKRGLWHLIVQRIQSVYHNIYNLGVLSIAVGDPNLNNGYNDGIYFCYNIILFNLI